MADYFPVLSRAVAGLETNTGEARRAVYDRARAAIVRQLRAIDPPIAEEDISRERMQLEEAIRRVEANAGGAPAAAPTPAAPPPAAPQPRPVLGAASGAQNDAPKAASAAPVDRPSSAARTSAPAQPAPDAARPERRDEAAAPDRPKRRDGQGRDGQGRNGQAGQKRADGPAGKQARPATRADGRPIIRAAGETGEATKSKRSGPMMAFALVAVVALGVGAYAARGPIAALFGGGETRVETAATPPSQAPSDAKPAETPAAADDKSGDRLPQDNAAADRPAADEPITGGGPGQQETPAGQTPPPVEQEVARAPEPTAPPPAAEPARPAETPSSPGTAALVAQRAVLYEEGPNQQSGEALQGTILWRTESVSGGQNQPLETALRGEIDIPGRKVRATLTLRRNADPTLPASHTIEIQFSLPDDFPNAGISNVPGVLMKADESARGTAVAGLSVRVTNGFFLIGLSNLDTERAVNEQLLRDRGWIDIPILYDNGRRAVLTLEKGTPGGQAFQDAFAAWRSASASNPAPAPTAP